MAEVPREQASVDAGRATGPWERLADRPCPQGSELTWENFGAQFVLAHCTGCHGRDRMGVDRKGAPAAVTFDGPPAIRGLAGRIWAVSADDNATMPPVGGPPAYERRLFGEWLACGAPTRVP
ncbi:MAG: hypothetical protein OXU20_06145 [Myxococcales bacterium]|nr:hypothetical protein [Myxococcales bacterium]MDD9965339.1 hypothetical protein [Myxococcales bacterium]